MKAFEIEKKYNITVINHPLYAEGSEICSCGHHAKYHYGKGSAGYCEKCSPLRHDFTQKGPKSKLLIFLTNLLYGPLGLHEQHRFAYAHNFTPKIQPPTPKVSGGK